MEKLLCETIDFWNKYVFWLNLIQICVFFALARFFYEKLWIFGAIGGG